MSGRRAAIVATGSKVPESVRTNDDPIFGYLRSHGGSRLFTGYEERRVLAPGETVEDLVVGASRRAIEGAGCAVDDVDLVIGYSSVGRWETPNPLVHAMKELGVGTNVPILPMNNEFAIFLAGLDMGTVYVESHRAEHVLVAVGTNWTRYVDYRTQPAISAADGACAAVIAATDDQRHFAVIDHMVTYYPQYLGGMYMAADEVTPVLDPPAFTGPTFHLNDLGVAGFQDAGANGPVELTEKVVARNGLAMDDITFIGHQASAVLNDHWKECLGLGDEQFISTIAEYANMTSASIGVNLDRCFGDITTDHVVLMALGPEIAVHVLLLERGHPDRG